MSKIDPSYFVPLRGYEGRYLINTEGVVWDSLKEREVSQVATGVPDYLYVNLTHPVTKKRKLKRLHRLIAETFLPNPDNLPIVDHIDRDRYNNSLSNLRWACRKTNVRNTDNVSMVSVGGELRSIKEVVEELFPDNEKYMYGFIYPRRDMSLEEILLCLEELEEKEEKLLKEKNRAKEVGLSLPAYRDRLKRGWCEWNIENNIPPLTPIKEKDLPHTWVRKNKYVLRTDFIYTCRSHLFTVEGITSTRDYFLMKYRTTESRVLHFMRKYKLSFEEAILFKPKRVRLVRLNGKEMTVKELWEKFGLNPKLATNCVSRYKLTYLEVLQKYGVDTSGINSLEY